MVDAKALRIGALAAGGLLALFVASALFWLVTRFVSRILTWSVLLLLVAGVGYAAYQLYSGWNAAGEEAATSVDAGGTAEGPTDVESVQERYTRGELTEAEMEAELEEAVGATGSDVPERERES